MPLSPIFPLDMLKPGEWADVADVTGDASWVCRMAELGVREGCRIQMIQGGTPCMLRIADCKFCLRGDDTSQIFVRPLVTKAQ